MKTNQPGEVNSGSAKRWIPALSPLSSDCWSTSPTPWLPLPVLISWMLQYVPDVTFTPATFVIFFHWEVSVEFNLNPISECEGADPHLSWRLSVHVSHPQASIIYIAAPPKAQGTTGSVDEKSASQSWSNTYLYCMAHWVRSTQCRDYHSFPGNFIIICMTGRSHVTIQVALPFKSKVHRHQCLPEAISGKQLQ